METAILISGSIALVLATVLGLAWIGEAIRQVVHNDHEYEEDL